MKNESNLLTEYCVSLFEDKDDKGDKSDNFQIIFICLAEDEDHAEEQALNAYPCGEITHIAIME